MASIRPGRAVRGSVEQSEWTDTGHRASNPPVMPRPALLIRAIIALASIIEARYAGASTLIVPDQVPTLQAAADSAVDTVLVREGTYPDPATFLLPVVLLGRGSGS